jgi:hypothetical protein
MLKLTNRKMVLIILITMCYALLSCGGSSGNGESGENDDHSDRYDRTDLENAERLWNKKDIASYTYTYRETRFLVEREDVVITVQDGQITGAFNTPSGTYVATDELEKLPTISTLFDLIAEALDSEQSVVKAQHDSVYGYPEVIKIDEYPKMEDDEVEYQVIEFQ